MALLQGTIDADGWMFVRGVTGDQSVDVVGPAATADKIDINGGSHYAGVYLASPSTVILRSFFDGLDTDRDPRVGYVQTISALCLDAPVMPQVLPGLKRLGVYALLLEGDTVLDFMGQADAKARFGGSSSAGDAKADAPFYPFTAFLRLPNPQFQSIFWHPMPNGSMRRAAGQIVDPASRPSPQAEVSRVASLRSVIRPFLVEEAQIAAVCIVDAATFRATVLPEKVASMSLFDLVVAAYRDVLGQPIEIQDALAAGPYLILLTAEHDAFVARLDWIDGAPWLTIWEIDHDSFERIERDAAVHALGVMQDTYLARYPSTTVVAPPAPTGRGTRGVKPIPDIGRIQSAPTFSLIFTATVGRWIEHTTRSHPKTQFSPVSSISTRVDWRYDPSGEDLEVVLHKPKVSAVPSDIGRHWDNYQTLLANPFTTDLADPSPFTLVDAPWLDTAPKAPRTA
jgi:hypothetical protein